MKRIKSHHIISALAFSGIAFFALNFGGSNQPLFQNLDKFVVFATEETRISEGAQISNGDLGSNKKLDIQKDVIINGNLFADNIMIDKNSSINGNVSFNKLQIKKESKIFGTQIKPVQIPIANLPPIPDFPTGAQNFAFAGATNTLPAGNYRNITLEKDSHLVLSGGIYNLENFELEENSTIIFSATTILNIKNELRAQQNLSILAGQNSTFDDLQINYPNKKPIHFGKNSFLNFKLLAPKADVNIGEQSTLRGQILAKKITVEKNSILSRDEIFAKESDPEKIIEDDRELLMLNEIVLMLNNSAVFSDALNIAALVNGRIIGFVDLPQVYKIEVNVNTVSELDSLISLIESQGNPLVLFAMRNSLGALR